MTRLTIELTPDIYVRLQAEAQRQGRAEQDIADYEVRRELIHARRVSGVQQIDLLRARIGHLAVPSETLFLAAEFWADLRQHGLPTAHHAALDGDVILAAQAALLLAMGHSVVIATTNVGHLARLVPADRWQNITV